MARKKKAVIAPTSKSSDKEIVNFLSSINKKLSGYYNVAGEDVGEQMSGRVQQVLTFKKWLTGGKGVEEETLPLVDGKIALRKKEDKAAAINYIRKVLERQEAKIAESKATAIAAGESFTDDMRSKTITETLTAIPTVQEKIKKVEDDLMGINKSVTYEHLAQGENEKKRSFNRRAKEMAIREMQARAVQVYEDDFSEVISKLYEEYGANVDIIEQLRSQRWTGEIMEEANIRAMGIHVTRR